MKRIVFTQRVEVIESYGERRDCADQNISKFIDTCGFLPVPIMNVPSLADSFCDSIHPDGIILTGGNDLAAYGGNAPERDETEKRLIEYAVNNGVPLLGICRGMQMIAAFYGNRLQRVDGHVRKEHEIKGIINRKAVNSFHGMGVLEVKEPIATLARADDGVIEALEHRDQKIAGIMWHPERVPGFDNEDLAMVKHFYEEGSLR